MKSVLHSDQYIGRHIRGQGSIAVGLGKGYNGARAFEILGCVTTVARFGGLPNRNTYV